MKFSLFHKWPWIGLPRRQHSEWCSSGFVDDAMF